MIMFIDIICLYCCIYTRVLCECDKIVSMWNGRFDLIFHISCVRFPCFATTTPSASVDTPLELEQN